MGFPFDPGAATSGLVYNVLDYGADPTGVADGTTAIQATLKAAGTDIAYVPAGGTFLCGALTIPSGCRFIIDGTLKASASLAAPWIVFDNVVHQNTLVAGSGTLDATAVTSALCTCVIKASAVSIKNVRVKNLRIVNAPVTGVFMSESTFTTSKKEVSGMDIDGHGIVSTGYGIYGDYVGALDIDRNRIYSPNGDDCIEMGHSGSTNLNGLNVNIRATGNTCLGGELQFPFSDDAQIIGNTVDGATIQNDTNTANGVVIIGNKVLNATPGGGYAGIRVAGANAVISGNSVFVTTGNGIAWTGENGQTVTGNYIYSSAAADTGTGIYDGGSGGGSTITGNNIDGNGSGGFTYAWSLSGSKNVMSGNVATTGCFNGLTGGMTDSTFVANTINVRNISLLSIGTGSVASNNQGYNPAGPQTAPTVPASGTALTNPFPFDTTVYVTGGTVTAVAIGGTATGLTSGPFSVPAGETITLTYSAAPTWVWVGH